MLTYLSNGSHRNHYRMRIIGHVLASARDVGRDDVVAMCARLQRAHYAGWKRNHDARDWQDVVEIYEALVE